MKGIPDQNIKCEKCGIYESHHIVGYQRWCCDCYVRGGNPPADWHYRCMKVYNEIKLIGKGSGDDYPVIEEYHKLKDK